MHFKVLESHQVDGKTRVLIEADDSSLSVVMHLFQDMAEFAHILRYKVNTHEKAEEWKRKTAEGEPERLAFRKDILLRYRSMKGMKQHERYRQIKADLHAQGLEYTFSQVEAAVSNAIKDERQARACRKVAGGIVVEEPRDHAESVKAGHSAGFRGGSDHRVRLVSSAPGGLIAEKPIPIESKAATLNR
jgi:hypothetical protein